MKYYKVLEENESAYYEIAEIKELYNIYYVYHGANSAQKSYKIFSRKFFEISRKLYKVSGIFGILI